MILKRDSKRIKELEKINVQHRKLNGKLRQEIDILESQLDFITYQNIVIENLQQENEELKKNQRYYKNGVFSLEYDKETLSDMVDDYKSRIDKAVEYIKEHIQKYDIDGSIGDFDEFDMLTKPNYLLNILQNGSDSE